MKAKKAFGLQYYILIAAIFLGLGFFFVSRIDAKEFQGVIGDYNFNLIRAADESEITLLYIDQSAKNALPQAIYDLAQNGGVSEIEFTDNEQTESYQCGKFDGAFVWYQIAKDGNAYVESDCFDEKLPRLNLEYYFNRILNSFLLAYPKNIITDNYDYDVNGDIEIIGNAKEPLEFDITKSELVQTQQEAPATPNEQGLVDFTGTEFCPKGKKCILKQDAFELFKNAFNLAKQRSKNLEFVSGYRTLEQQWALWNGSTSDRYAQKYPDPNIRKLYVCDPRGGGIGCPHLTGNAVDVTFKGKTTSEMSRAEKQELKSIMVQSGWVKYIREAWHFECCGTARYAEARRQGVDEV